MATAAAPHVGIAVPAATVGVATNVNVRAVVAQLPVEGPLTL